VKALGIAGVVGASVLAHLALLGAPAATGRVDPGPAPRPALAHRADLAARVDAVALPVRLAAERRALVARARVDRGAGRLLLGEFLLAASALDAREERRPFDLAEARTRWASRLEQLEPARDLRRAIPEVFGDLHYFGRPGRSMGDALLEGGGACEPLTHLIVAAVHDLGHPERARLRFYGGDADGGTTHLAPVYPEGRGEIDLLTGSAARRTGALLAAADLVDVYARAHGIDAPAPSSSGGGGGSGEVEPHPSSMADGYPPNQDRYPGAVPLYAERAVQDAAATDPADVMPAEDAADCAFFLRKAVLDPPALLVSAADDPPGVFAGFPVELRRVPTTAQLDRTSAMVQAAERSVQASRAPARAAEHLMAVACLTALYDEAATDFALVSERELAHVALGKRRAAAREGERLLAGVDWDGPEGTRLLASLADGFEGRSWLLLVLRGGEVPVRRLAGDDGREESWGRTDALAALLVAPASRDGAVTLASALPRRAQIDVMHEVFHAHDHQRPWASSYALEGAGEGDFARAYRVFRGLAWGLWDGGRPQDEILAALLHGAEVERLDRTWVAGLAEYYGRHALGLHRIRADGAATARGLSRWLEEQGLTDLDTYRAALGAARDPT
jgi:hypothetical protein